MIKQIAIVSAVEGGLCCCCAIFAGWGGGCVCVCGFFKMTSKVHDKPDSEGSLPIACAVSL